MILNNNVNTKDQLITAASGLFRKFGIRSIAMDTIARECGMSKKTLYLFFCDKVTLVNAVVQRLAAAHKQQLKTATLNSRSAVEEVFNEFKIYTVALLDIHAVFFYELEKSFSESWSLLNDFNIKHNYAFVISNLQRGISEGYYRTDLDLAATANIRISQLKLLLTRNVNFTEARNLLSNPDQVNLFYLHAITNSKGKKIIDKMLNEGDSSNSTKANINIRK